MTQFDGFKTSAAPGDVIGWMCQADWNPDGVLVITSATPVHQPAFAACGTCRVRRDLGLTGCFRCGGTGQIEREP